MPENVYKLEKKGNDLFDKWQSRNFKVNKDLIWKKD
jgi:hypothetical protein